MTASGPTAEPRGKGPTEGSRAGWQGLTLPKGGGALRGMGEKLDVNMFSGVVTLSIPVAAPPGRSGFGPQLSLTYHSGAGNGPFGLGWSVSLPAITRRTDRRLPRYRDDGEDADTFILSGAEDLVPSLVLRAGDWQADELDIAADDANYCVRRYRPRIEGLFARIERWTHATTGEIHWRTTSGNNVTSLYGRTAAGRVADPGNPARVFSWLIEESFDDKGNLITYSYKPEDRYGVPPDAPHERNRLSGEPAFTNRYIKRVRYGNQVPFVGGDYHFEIVFDYGDHDDLAPETTESHPWPSRHDPFSSCRPGFELRTYRLCRRVLSFHQFAELGPEPCLVRSTDLSYLSGPDRAVSLLAAIGETGYIRRPDGSYHSKALPEVELAYSEASPDDATHDVDPETVENLPAGLLPPLVEWLDLDGEGLPGALIEAEGAWWYKRNLGGGRLGRRELLSATPARATATNAPPVGSVHCRLMSVEADGILSLVELADPLSGFTERTADGAWAPFTPFPSVPTLDWSDPNLRLADLDGDGVSDLLLTGDDGFTWHLSLGRQGFGPSARAPYEDDEELGPQSRVRRGGANGFHRRYER